jgi:hypothetical protein
VVVAIKKEPNQLYGTAETVVGLGMARECAKTMLGHLLNQM